MASIFFLLIYLLGGGGERHVRIEKINHLERLLQNKSDTTFVINFWATWCKPCVEELPVFDSVLRYYPTEKVSLILVSLDFKSQYSTRLIPFINKNNPLPEVFLLDEPDYNTWIEKVDKSWSGAIPATLIFNGQTGRRYFFKKINKYKSKVFMVKFF
jgi:thiol-disulfide isomerase/thioredoxin